jgi:hypothetical protein
VVAPSGSDVPEVFVRYSRYVSVLKWLSLSLFAYVATHAFPDEKSESQIIVAYDTAGTNWKLSG